MDKSRVIRWFARVDTGLLFTLLLTIFSVWSTLTHPGLFVGHDTLNHAFRVAEIDRIWSSGILLPRWAETFYFGYGSPVFQYYAGLTYILSGLFVRLFGLDALGSLRLLVILCLPAASAGMYLFVRDHVGKLGGILAALVYIYSPYIVFTEPVTRGDYPELLCFALFPWVMWRFERLLRETRAVNFVWAALSLSLFSVSHNLMSVVLFALLIGSLLWRAFFHQMNRRKLGIALLASGIGIGLTAFFWLPVFLERAEVHLDNVPENIQSEQRNFFGFFVPMDRLLALSAPTDAGAANGVLLRLNLGVPQWGLALTGFTGMAGLWWLSRRKPIEPQRSRRTEKDVFLSPQPLVLSPLFFALSALVMILLMLPVSYGLWSSLSILNFMEFPWRLLGPTVFCLAFLGGTNAIWLMRLPGRVRNTLTTAFIILPVVLALPTLYIPDDRAANLDTSQAGYLSAELNGSVSPGTSARNDFLPRDVLVLPGATQSLLDDYGDGYPVDKANRESIPPGNNVVLFEHTPESDTWTVNATTPFTLETFTFNFAGWLAEVDGQNVPITASQPHGFITIPIPAGEHTVHLFLGQTPARQLGLGVSLLSVVLLVGVVILSARRHFSHESIQSPDEDGDPSVHIYLLSGLLTLLMVFLFMREDIAWVNSSPGEAIPAQYSTDFAFGDDIHLLGYDLSAESVKPGDWLEVVLYWYARQSPVANYTSFLHFSAGDSPLSQANKGNPAERATREWLPGAYLRDAYTLHIPNDISPREYRLNIGLYICDTRPTGECGNGDRLQVYDADGVALGDLLHLTVIRVR